MTRSELHEIEAEYPMRRRNFWAALVRALLDM